MSGAPTVNPLWDRHDHGKVPRVRFLLEWVTGDEVVQSLRSDLHGLLDEARGGDLILDFERVQMFDSMFVTVIFGLVKRLGKEGGKLALVHLSPKVKEIFQSMPIETLPGLRLCDSVDAALAWCAGASTA